MSFEVFDARLRMPFSPVVASPSMCGKTQFVLKLLESWNILVDSQFDYIVWSYGQKTEALEKIKKLYGDKITLVVGIPDDLTGFTKQKQHGVFIFDDSQSEICDSQEIADLFTKKCHHENISTIVIFQNLFCEGKHRKTIYRNASYLILFNNPLDYTLAYSLARKIYPQRSSIFLDMFKNAMKKPYGYLFIDGKVSTPEDARFRTDLFGKNFQRVLVPNKA